MLKEAIGVIPTSSMNMALVHLALRNGYPVDLGFHTKESRLLFEEERKIKELPGIEFPDTPGLTIASNFSEAVKDKKIVFVTPRSWDLRTILEEVAPYIRSDAILVCGTKGFDEYHKKFYTPSQVIEQMIPNSRNNLAIISGPNFAGQIINGVTTITTVAAHKKRIAQEVRDIVCNYNNNGNGKDFLVDIYKGNPQDVEIVGAFKNVVGFVMGFALTLDKFDTNTGAAILFEGLQEVSLLCKKMGRSSRAIMRPCGVGDYGLLMNSRVSRNVTAGENFGRGEWDLEYLMDPKHTIEGVRTVKAVAYLAGKRIKYMPLAAYAYLILYGGMNPQEAVRDLLEGKAPPISPLA
ncbi:hypothetical protein KKE03_01155 [Patescibacteria group bacterium]|nr:hypothetical protein [Patescibacteria group bacterium]